jgi:sporulation protein YlmC with PRC-barrel domain
MNKLLAIAAVVGISTLGVSPLASAEGDAALRLDGMKISEIEGKAVLTNTGEKVGDVSDVVYDDTGSNKLVIVGLDGAVGAGAKEVAIPLSRLSLSQDGKQLATNLTRPEIEAMPDVDPGDYQKVEGT